MTTERSSASSDPVNPDRAARSTGHAARSRPPRLDAVRVDIETTTDDEAHAVLLIHGQPCTSIVWTRVRPLLQSHGLRVLAIDRPGDGHASGEPLNQFETAATIATALDDQHANPTVVVGHSLGAGIALALAATAPRHVRALVLVAPAAGLSALTATDWVLAAPVLGPAVSWLGFRAAGLALHLPGLQRRILIDRCGLCPADAAEVVRRFSRSRIWRSLVVEQRHLVADAHQLQQHLPGIRCPAVVLAGTRDRIVRTRVAAAISRQLPESALITTRAGHLIPIDDPDAVINAILRALRWQYRKSAVRSADPRAGSAG
jgi:pimeloyl-ACP methyl ester carboxylesterase